MYSHCMKYLKVSGSLFGQCDGTISFLENASECGGEEVGDAANEVFVFVEPLIFWFLANENRHEGVIKEPCVGSARIIPLRSKATYRGCFRRCVQSFWPMRPLVAIRFGFHLQNIDREG